MSAYPIPCVNRLYTDDEPQSLLVDRNFNMSPSSKASSGARDWVRDINVMLRFNQGFRTTSDARPFDHEDDEDNDDSDSVGVERSRIEGAKIGS